MGVLEDAIRDHLELKRRHGASEEEVEQKELEALGPARREFEAPAEETEQEELHEEAEHAEPALDAQAQPPAEDEPPPLVDPSFAGGDAPDFADDEEEEEEPERDPRNWDFD